MTGPRRAWTLWEQHRFEDDQKEEFRSIRNEVKALRTQMTLMLGGLGLIAFLLPIAAPFIRALLNIEVPNGQGQ